MQDTSPEQDWLDQLCARNGYTHAKLLDEERYALIMPLMFTRAIITGRIGQGACYDDRWCYHNEKDALSAFHAWDGTGEPDGWHRHPATGRRRPSAEAELEYINP